MSKVVILENTLDNHYKEYRVRVFKLPSENQPRYIVMTWWGRIGSSLRSKKIWDSKTDFNDGYNSGYSNENWAENFAKTKIMEKIRRGYEIISGDKFIKALPPDRDEMAMLMLNDL